MKIRLGWMKTVTWATLAMLSASGALAAGARQEKDELFAGTEKFASHAKNSTEVNLDKRMLGLASGMGGGKSDSELMRKMDFVIVRSYEYANTGDYKMADVEEFTKRLDGGGWTHIVRERSDKETTDICIRSDSEGQVSELVVIAAEPKELTFVHLKGHLSLNDLMKAGAQYGVPQGASGGDDPKLKKREE